MNDGGSWCDKCRQPIPGGRLACPRCTEKRAAEEIRNIQVGYLERVLDGKWPMKMVQVSGGMLHAVLYLHASRAYCGREIPNAGRREMRFDDAMAKMCAACRVQVKARLEEMGARR